ncbi:glutamine-hydrolyzing carbamoyl-phosphate synthase small subunit [Sphingomonas sp.]|uniref:glutamine-hydrolyzing carbamoyl-phosphate synthase small subunit n=1 Tax=Sphingomonas sp. TaxID=28214 RepID=UPI00286BE0AD|nr:glutamine-hydrolyzing carbamoyl-phosphate synthase small subunit [Sphingomonas sp.]
MADPRSTSARPDGATGVIVFADGRVIWGRGFGAEGSGVGELCFNTAMTGYQEVMTDPSYARQVVAFTFPHIGNVGANEEDVEAGAAHALGCFVREAVTSPSNFRSTQDFPGWMAATGRIGVSGVDTRALTHLVRREGPPTVAFAHDAGGEFDLEELRESAAGWPGLEGMDLAKEVSRGQLEAWSGGKWSLSRGYEEGVSTSLDTNGAGEGAQKKPFVPSEVEGRQPHVAAIDYGAKRNIFRNLVEAGARVTIFPASARFEEVMAVAPDGFFLSNGPGDPAATAVYAVPLIKQLLATGKPLFGICLGHQLLALSVGGKTAKMFQGHRGANHPVKRLADGAVEITSMNHGFAVERDGLPANVRETHVSLFDDSNCGIELTDRPAFSVQYHPEASPGPMDSFYLFEKFVGMMQK